jgi:hypothetical protein
MASVSKTTFNITLDAECRWAECHGAFTAPSMQQSKNNQQAYELIETSAVYLFYVSDVIFQKWL